VGDLNIFRQEFKKDCLLINKNISRIRWIEKKNRDNSSSFYAFDLISFPKEFILQNNQNHRQLLSNARTKREKEEFTKEAIELFC